MKVKKNGTGAMATTKTDVFIGLQHENCYLVGGMNLWLEKNKTLGGGGGGGLLVSNFSCWGDEEIFGWSGGLHPPSKEKPE